MKYFIENKEGEWLKNPDEVMGPGQPNCWTRDPDKAWGFDKETDHDWLWALFPKKQKEDRDNSLEGPAFLVRLLLKLIDEGTLALDTKITEHEFTEVFPMHYKDINHDFWMQMPGGDMYRVFSSYSEVEETKEFKEGFRKDLLGF